MTVKCGYQGGFAALSDDEQLEKNIEEAKKDFKKYRSLLMKNKPSVLANKIIELEKNNNFLTYSLKNCMSTITMLRSRVDEMTISYTSLVEKVKK